MIRTTALATSLAMLAAAPALAGGYVAPVVDVEPVVVTPAPIIAAWTGGYVGANLNYGKTDTLDLGDGFSARPDGANGALRAGYDWQRGNGVFGLGAEYNFTKYKDDITGVDGPDGEARLKDLGMVFARAGYAFNDQTMAYGLLGYSHGKLELANGTTISETVKGPTLGIGAEHRFNENWSGYAEYAHTRFGTVDIVDQKVKLDQVKLGVNFRF
ncbi:outer membrane immunogenic protein [Paracoccus alkenifer]|uniref:Outer membrane immunogenic protein n=2 Tax=Paracoccus alkenifer TaxID=65735 RepID=A0A1H6MZY0_9RHOB|nr:outer membrane immunogenic protein [Paracoccus alkenifer]